MIIVNKKLLSKICVSIIMIIILIIPFNIVIAKSNHNIQDLKSLKKIMEISAEYYSKSKEQGELIELYYNAWESFSYDEKNTLVMGKRPDLYTAYLETSSKWNRDLETLVKFRTPVYLAIGEDDSYYGSSSLKETYTKLHAMYENQGLSNNEIDEILILDVYQQDYFTEHGYTDQHAGGQAFAFDEHIMSWLFSK